MGSSVEKKKKKKKKKKKNMQIYLNGSAPSNKMAAMSIYGKNS